MTQAAPSELRSLILQGSGPQVIATFLDALSQPERVTAIRGLSRREQQQLWERVDGFAPLSVDDVVPPTAPALVPVRHYGRNSLPLFSLFEKRFYRCAEPAQLAGANFQAVSPLTGPGYFVLRADAARREVIVDYTALPASKPAHWPTIVRNDRGFSRFVFGSMIDTLRRVSTHVTIGRAARHGQTLDAWFVLCREEVA